MEVRYCPKNNHGTLLTNLMSSVKHLAAIKAEKHTKSNWRSLQSLGWTVVPVCVEEISEEEAEYFKAFPIRREQEHLY